ncbi:hypothetical protein EDB19DRAFT_1961585 [Suillus lakei]|nr:hypothetical protein EDB19DRAFT_1961585 [Suillus lakei]
MFRIIFKQAEFTVLSGTLLSGGTEEYLITLPRLRIDRLWCGSPYIELVETSDNQSSAGWLSAIEYKRKVYFSGRSHTLNAMLTPPTHVHTAPRVVEGISPTTSRDSYSGVAFRDVTLPKDEITVAPVEEHGEWENRKL